MAAADAPGAVTAMATSAKEADHEQQPAQDGHDFTGASPVLAIDESEYQPQLDRKLHALKELFSTLCPPGEQLPEVEVFTSVPSHYRMRAEFTVWGVSNKALQQGPPDVHYIMYDTSSNVKPPPRVRMDRFPVGSKLMNALMPVVLEACNQVPVLRERLFQVNFHTALSGESMVTLLYHKKLDDVWQEAALQLRAKLDKVDGTNGHTPHVVGRARKQKVELQQSYITERLEVNGRAYHYRQVEGSFSQPNAGVCQHMLSWAQSVTTPTATTHTSSEGAAATAATSQQQGGGQAGAGGGGGGGGLRHDHELLELYCGNANFTIPLAANFRRVVATELSKSSVEAARANITANQVDNIFIARMSSEEFSEAWRTKATKKRLEGLGDWSALSMKTLLVDPPRAGLDPQTLELAQSFDNIVYISCNPQTLRENLQTLVQTHKVVRFAAFDQFPFTKHLESGVYLQRR